jgi:hydrophobic/amphiphilic exporter-1 (mainly G- bacteria), HAE1 family
MKQNNTEQSYLERLRFDPKLLVGPVAKYLKNFRLTLLLIIAVVFLGVISYLNLPKRLNPEVKIPIVTIVTVLPGAGPEDVESLVTVPIEKEINSLTGIDTVSSVSRDNVSAITVQFTNTTNRDDARDEVQRIVDSIRDLPEDAQTPAVRALDFENQPIWEFALTTTGDIGSLQRFASRLTERLENNPKIDNVVVRGIEDQEVVVNIDPERLAVYGISPLQLSQLLKSSGNSYPAGTIDSSNNSFSFTINPGIETVEDIRSLRISLNGSVVPLGDIATVREQSKPNQTQAFIATKTETARRVITFSVYKTTATTITDGVREAEDIVDTELAVMGEDRFSVQTLNNTADEISDQFAELLSEFRATIILVFLALFVFLGLKQAVISSFTVPLTFLTSFFFMQQFGMSINFLSLFAFLIALGLLVDDTIVVISAMTTYFKTGKFTPYQTGLVVWKDTIVPIWSTTITTIWSFVPLLLATGIIGEFIKPIPVVVTITMLSSTAIAVLITLPIMILILKPQFPGRVVLMLRILGLVTVGVLVVVLLGRNPLFIPAALLFGVLSYVVIRVRNVLVQKVNSFVHTIPYYSSIQAFFVRSSEHGVISLDGFSSWYERSIKKVLLNAMSRRKVVAGVVVYALVGFSLLPLGFVKNEFFPKSDSERLFVQLELPAGSTLERVSDETVRLLEQFRNNQYADFLIAEVGVGAPTGFSMGGSSQNIGLITLHLPPQADRKVSSIIIADELRKEAAAITTSKVSVVEQSGGPPAGADLQMEISGDDLAELNRYADTLVTFLESQNGTTNVEKSIKSGTSAVVFVPNADVIAENGLTVDAVGLAMRLYASGFTLDELQLDNTKEDKTPVRFTYSDSRPTTQSLGQIQIQTRNGAVPLLSLGRLELKANPTSITRQNGKRTITVTAGVRSGFSTSDLNRSFESYVQTLNLPDGYSWQTGGVNEENARSVQSIVQAMGVALLLILVTMVLQFSSFRQAVIVLLVIPLAVSSVFYAFALTGTPLSFPALIGVLSLFGIVVTNSMFIVDKINLNQKEGMEFVDAIADAGASRMEPIILTKLSTVLGLLPITLSDPLWRGLGGAIISGLLIASTIMLLFIPVVYYQWFKKADEK